MIFKIFQLLVGLIMVSMSAKAGAMPVIDVTLVKTNLVNARRDLIEQILQGERQIMQYKQLVEQVRQIDSYLDRFGDPKAVSLDALDDALKFLHTLDPGKTSDEIFRTIDGDSVFDEMPVTGYKPITPEIRVNGRQVGTRNSEVYAPEIASRRALAYYDEVRDSVLQNRQALRASLDAALVELQSAATASQVAKLDVVIRSLESQLSATATDLQLAESAATLRLLRNQTEERIAAKAAVEEKRALLKINTELEVKTFPLPTRPILFKR